MSAEQLRAYMGWLAVTASFIERDERVLALVSELRSCLNEGRQVFLCGNGGSAANANHIANDLVRLGIRAHSLSANVATLTCIANDDGYEKVFSKQLQVLANRGDLLIALSGSGNSPNIVHVLGFANAMGLMTCAILGYDGGAAKILAELPIHIEVHDQQIAEDLQLSIAHAVSQQLWAGVKSA